MFTSFSTSVFLPNFKTLKLTFQQTSNDSNILTWLRWLLHQFAYAAYRYHTSMAPLSEPSESGSPSTSGSQRLNTLFNINDLDRIDQIPEYLAEFLQSRPTKLWIEFTSPDNPILLGKQRAWFVIDVDTPVTRESQTFVSCRLVLGRPRDPLSTDGPVYILLSEHQDRDPDTQAIFAFPLVVDPPQRLNLGDWIRLLRGRLRTPRTALRPMFAGDLTKFRFVQPSPNSP
jgi:hypothetical protein